MCALCPEGEIGPGGLLIEMCWRLIDVSAPVSGLFRTTVLIAGFTSHREGEKKSMVAGATRVYSLQADINAFAEESVIFIICHFVSSDQTKVYITSEL